MGSLVEKTVGIAVAFDLNEKKTESTIPSSCDREDCRSIANHVIISSLNYSILALLISQVWRNRVFLIFPSGAIL